MWTLSIRLKLLDESPILFDIPIHSNIIPSWTFFIESSFCYASFFLLVALFVISTTYSVKRDYLIC